MYLSKCVINTARPVNPYQLHRELWKLFPDRPNDKRDFLFRVENLGRKEPQRILLQSKERPEMPPTLREGSPKRTIRCG